MKIKILKNDILAFHEINRLEIFQIGTKLYDETNGSENCKRRYYMYLTHFWPVFFLSRSMPP